jgi:hypothetical protein
LAKEKDARPAEKSSEILREMRESVSPKRNAQKIAEEAKRRDFERAKELAFLGDEEAFVALMKEREPNITADELLRRILLFRELKRIRSNGP